MAMVDRLHVRPLATSGEAGAAAAHVVANALLERLARPGQARVVFAAAPSQDAVLRALSETEGIDWRRVTAFQMDEYIGLEEGDPRSFGTYLDEHILSIVHPGEVHKLHSNGDGAAEAARYAALLGEAPIDVVCLGIGENGHIAFNDPDVADFDDPVDAKVVALDGVSRQQQVNDGCFPTIGAVPTHAVTLTVPALSSGSRLVACASGSRKRAAVHRALFGPVAASCPASILRRHDDAWLFLDEAAVPAQLSVDASGQLE